MGWLCAGTSSETEYSEPVQAPLPSSLFSSSPFSNIENKRDHSKQQQASFPSTVFSALPSQSGLLSAFPGFPIPGSPPTAAYAPPFGKSTSTPQHASQIGKNIYILQIFNQAIIWYCLLPSMLQHLYFCIVPWFLSGHNSHVIPNPRNQRVCHDFTKISFIMCHLSP